MPMESKETSKENPQEKENTVQDTSGGISQKQKQTEEIKSEKTPRQKKQKKKFHLSFVWKLLIFILVLVIGGFIYFFLTMESPPRVEDPEPEDNPPAVRPEEPSPIKTYKSDEFHFSVQYNKEEHELREISADGNQPKQFWIIYKGDSQGEIKTESDLTDGYILKISAYKGIDRGVTDLARRKREKYSLECPGIVEIGDVYGSNISGVDATSFNVINCPQNYVESFVQFRGNVIEFAQIYRGDIGFRQSYKAQTEQILRSIEWEHNPAEQPEIEQFTHREFQLSFIHPLLNTSCCSVTSPSLQGLRKVVVLADPARKNDEGEVLDKFGIFAYPVKRESFQLFLNQQKQALIQEYKVVEERNPTDLSEQRVQIGGYDAFKLVNYAWWGDVIYMDHPNSDADYFLVFVMPNEVSDEFRGVINEVLSTFEFEVEEY